MAEAIHGFAPMDGEIAGITQIRGSTIDRNYSKYTRHFQNWP